MHTTLLPVFIRRYTSYPNNALLGATKCLEDKSSEDQHLTPIYDPFVIEVTDDIEDQLSANQDLIPYFVTTVFKDYECEAKNQLKRKVEYAFRQYDRVYRHLTSNLMNNFSKKRHLHPRTFDFIDLPGTRHTSKVNVSEPSVPHIHSVYLLHTETLKLFEDLRSTDFQVIRTHPSLKNIVESIDARPIADGTIDRVVNYSSKFARNRAADDVPLFTMYPITTDEQRTRRDALRFESMLSEQERQNLEGKYLRRVSVDHPLHQIAMNNL